MKIRLKRRRLLAFRIWFRRLREFRRRRMSLKNRLRYSIISLVTVMVAIQFLATLRVTAESDFADALERSNAMATQVLSLLQDRLTREVQHADPPPRDLDETIALWTEFLENDQAMTGLLESLMASSSAANEIQICDRVGRILTTSTPSTPRLTFKSLPDFGEWNIRPLWTRLFEVLSTRREFSTTIPLGVEVDGEQEQIFIIRVLVSSVLLRETLMPQVRNLLVTSSLSLLAAIMLAVLFSNMVLRAVNRLAKRIEHLTAGDFDSATAPPGRESDEVAAVSSKLNLLSEQFRDAMQVRGNLDQLLRSIEGAVMMFDPDRRLVLAGQPAERLLGRPRNEMIGQSIDEIFPPESALGAVVLTAAEGRFPVRDRPTMLKRNGQPPVRLLVTVESLENLPGLHQLGTLVTLRDAESRRRLQNQIDVSTRLTSISRLTGGVAHEIKNPLNAIALHLEILKAKLAEAPAVGDEVDVIEREIARLDRVVKTFLDFTRPVELQLDPINLIEMAGEVEALVSPEAEKNHVEVKVRSDLEAAIVDADHDLLKQAVLNVVINGIEAMPNGGTLAMEIAEDGDDYVLSIADRGAGISPEAREKIFNLYFTTKEEGSGIGLAMTFRVVHLHNATIDFTSELGQGTTFRLRFPASDESAAPVDEQPASPRRVFDIGQPQSS